MFESLMELIERRRSYSLGLAERVEDGADSKVELEKKKYFFLRILEKIVFSNELSNDEKIIAKKRCTEIMDEFEKMKEGL